MRQCRQPACHRSHGWNRHKLLPCAASLRAFSRAAATLSTETVSGIPLAPHEPTFRCQSHQETPQAPSHPVLQESQSCWGGVECQNICPPWQLSLSAGAVLLRGVLSRKDRLPSLTLKTPLNPNRHGSLQQRRESVAHCNTRCD